MKLCRYKKNLKEFFVVQSTLWVKAVTQFFKPFVYAFSPLSSSTPSHQILGVSLSFPELPLPPSQLTEPSVFSPSYTTQEFQILGEVTLYNLPRGADSLVGPNAPQNSIRPRTVSAFRRPQKILPESSCGLIL